MKPLARLTLGPGSAMLISLDNAFLTPQAKSVLQANGIGADGFFLSRVNADVAPIPVTAFDTTYNFQFVAAGDRRMDLAITIRTCVIAGDTASVQAGAGIVADSDPKAEQQECINKAKALFRAAEEAKRFASAARRGQ